MLIFDVLPSALPVISPPLKPVEIIVRDTATGFEKSFTEKLTSDSATATDVRKELTLFSVDLSSALDRLISLEAQLPYSDSAVGYEFVSEFSKEAFERGTPSEVAWIELQLTDLASAYDALIEHIGQIFGYELATGIEVRLSPIPWWRSDAATGYELTGRLAKTLFDTAFGYERYELELPVFDVSTAIDRVIELLSLISKADFAAGLEVRLSPVPIWTGDAALSKDIISAWSKPIKDAATGFEKALIGYLVEDKATGFERIAEIYREVPDVGTGIDKLVSPNLILKSDFAQGLELGLITLKELITSDTSKGQEIVTPRLFAISDKAIGQELVNISFEVRDLASAIDRVTDRILELFDKAGGIEVRLSPIPLKLQDIGTGLERWILDKEILTAEIGTGIEQRWIKIPTPPLLEGISSSFTVGVSKVVEETSPFIYEIMAIKEVNVTGYQRAFPISYIYALALNAKLKVLADMAKSLSYLYELKLTHEVTRHATSKFLMYHTYHRVLSDIEINLRKDILTKTEVDFPIPREFTVDVFKTMRWMQFKTYKIEGKLLIEPMTENKYRSYDSEEVIDIKSTFEVSTENLYRSYDSVQKFLQVPVDVRVSDQPLYFSKSLTIYFHGTYDVDIFLAEKQLLERIMRINYMIDIELYERIPIKTMLYEPLYLRIVKSLYYRPPIEIELSEGMRRGYGIGVYERVQFLKLYESIRRGKLAIIYKVLEAYKYLAELQEFMLNFRYVKYGDPVYPEDVNIFYDAFDLFIKFAESIYEEEFKGDEEVLFYLNNLKKAFNKFEKARSFAFVKARDRNQVVELIFRAREFLECLWRKS